MDEERKPNGEDRMDTEDATPAAVNGAEEKQGEGEAQTSTAAPAKIGFSFGGMAAGKRKVSIQGTKKEEGEEGRELVTAIQGSKMKTLFEKDDGPLVIPMPQPLRAKKAKIEGTDPPKLPPNIFDAIYYFLYFITIYVSQQYELMYLNLITLFIPFCRRGEAGIGTGRGGPEAGGPVGGGQGSGRGADHGGQGRHTGRARGGGHAAAPQVPPARPRHHRRRRREVRCSFPLPPSLHLLQVGLAQALTFRSQLTTRHDDTTRNTRFRFDVESRPEETTASAYDRVPVEKFGEAMLRGMLWKPGDPIGNTNKAYASIIVFVSSSP